MHGTIKYAFANSTPGWKFKGAISGEDGNQYNFTALSWSDINISLNNICEGQLVEFELKAPNPKGIIYPKNIRFQGEELKIKTQDDYTQVTHSYGRFKEFVYMKTEMIGLILDQLVENFSQSKYQSTSLLFKQIALTFNRLQDADFSFSGEGENASVDFPTGFFTADSQPILLHCIANRKSNNPWYAESVSVNGNVYGQSVFSQINANWYDVEKAINEILEMNDESAIGIIQRIERRCFDKEHSFIYLKQGIECPSDDADELYIPTDFVEKGGEEIYLLCVRRNGQYGFGWYFYTATYANAPITVFDKRIWLEKWAGYMPNDVLERLADQTLDEQWSFGNRTDYSILRNYLRYTFSYQFSNEAIGYSPNQQYAVFNTGLPDRNTYKYLYAFFERIPAIEDYAVHQLYFQQKYRFTGFVVSGRGGNGKELSSIRPLPNPPQYFEARTATVWELDFNSGNQVTLPDYDDTHILIQRCERIPLNFYRQSAAKSARLTQILNSDESLDEKYKRIREFFKPVLDNNPDSEVTHVYRELSSSLEKVIHTAVKRLSWNWRAVVPCYNPEKDETCFLLPVSFCDPVKTDRAMIATVTKLEEESIYTIHTVIPLDWAYLDARLVCRPESEWLAASFISEEDE